MTSDLRGACPCGPGVPPPKTEESRSPIRARLREGKNRQGGREVGVNLSRVYESFALMEDDEAMVLSNDDDDMLMDSEGDQESDGR